jgi:hypothetical protein
MDEDHRRTRIQGGEQLVLTFLAQVSARIVGEQHHAIGTQFVKRSDDLGGGAVDMWHRHGGEESEPTGMRFNKIGKVVVDVARKRGGVSRVSAGKWCPAWIPREPRW